MPGPSRIVLVGGGHAHVEVMRRFGEERWPAVEMVLVGKDRFTPYSGMLPGLIAGAYRFEDAHIDLERLAARSGVRFVHAAATGLDRDARQVRLADGRALGYDLLSLDVGITPDFTGIAGAERAIPVKPIAGFLERFEALLRRVLEPDGPRRIVVVGGGAGGVELVLAVRQRMLDEAAKAGLRARFSFVLVAAEPIVAGHAKPVRTHMLWVFRDKHVRLRESARVTAVEEGAVRLDDGSVVKADAVLLATAAKPPDWLGPSGLARDARGFLAVGATLQALNDPAVFAAGDVATMVECPRPKAGVFAVRQGPPLAGNLRRAAAGEPTRPFRPQSRWLSLIGTADGRAVASWGDWSASGAWAWRWKQYLDRRWMRRYQG